MVPFKEFQASHFYLSLLKGFNPPILVKKILIKRNNYVLNFNSLGYLLFFLALINKYLPGFSVLQSPTEAYLNNLYKANLLSLLVSFPDLNQFYTSSEANSKVDIFVIL